MDLGKKVDELHSLMLFQRDSNFLNDLDSVIITESPDFIIELEGREQPIGIELTQIVQTNKNYKGFSPIETVSLQKTLIDIAQKIFESKNIKRPFIDIYFQNDLKCSKNDYQKVGELISTFVESKLQSIGSNVSISVKVDDPDLKKYVSDFNIIYYENVSKSHWEKGGAYIVPELKMEVVISSVRNKEIRVSNYIRRSITEYWLLLTLDSFVTESSTFDLEILSLRPIESDVFERIILHDKRMGEVYELK